jgi:hypothetical protein
VSNNVRIVIYQHAERRRLLDSTLAIIGVLITIIVGISTYVASRTAPVGLRRHTVRLIGRSSDRNPLATLPPEQKPLSPN